MRLNRAQVELLLEMFGDQPDEEIEVSEGDKESWAGPGLYAYNPEYPDEGAAFLDPQGRSDPCSVARRD